MNWAMPSGIKSKIGTATAATALVTISAFIVPTQAFATATPLNTPTGTIDRAKVVYQDNYTNIPTTGTEASNKPGTNSNNDTDDEESSDVPW